jgi:hypothetical protein
MEQIWILISASVHVAAVTKRHHLGGLLNGTKVGRHLCAAPSQGRKGKGLFQVSFIKVLISFMSLAPPQPSHFPRASPPNSIYWRRSILTHEV